MRQLPYLLNMEFTQCFLSPPTLTYESFKAKERRDLITV